MNAPSESLTAEKNRAKLAERLRLASSRDEQGPLSFAQQRLWFLDQLEPNTPLYNIPSVTRLSGPLNIAALEKALRFIIGRHAPLRTRFACAGETPMQSAPSRFDFNLRVVDAASDAEAERWMREEIRRPFNLAGSEPLLRASLARLAPDKHLLVLNLHHIAADEWSLNILFRELEEFYAAQLESRPARLPALRVQYSDYAAWQRRRLQSDSGPEHLHYWENQLAGAPHSTELMTDHPRTRTASCPGRTLSRPLPADLGPRLKQLAGNRQSTLFMVALAAFNAVIYRYTGLEDIILGTPVAGRDHLDTEGLIGFFVNTLLLRSNLAGNPSFDELLQRVRNGAVAGYAHQDVPFEKVVESLRPERAMNHLAFTRIMFALQSRADADGSLHLPGLKAEWLEADTGTAKFDLTFVVRDVGSGLSAHVEYNSDLFDQPSMERLLEHFENLLGAAAANPALRLSELPMLGEAERRRLLVEWNDNASEYPRESCIHELFEKQARERPDAPAVAFGGIAWTYGELNARANRLAHCLRRRNLEPGAPVAICMERSAAMVAGILAILKAGGAYVPMDPRYPKERLAFILADTRTSILLTQQSLLAHLPHRRLQTVCVDTDGGEIASHSADNLPNRTAPEDVAYIIYTSGSTGEPKGVAVPHRAVNRLVFNTNYIKLDATDRIAQVSNMSFDAATFEIWGALLNGGQLRGIATDIALSPKEFARELREQDITAMFLTSALFSQLAAEVPGVFATMRTLMAGGEALDPKWVRAVLKDRPPLRLVNGYGPTENTTFTCCALLRDVPEGAASVPIGRPISNTQVYILDAHRNPVPAGVPGELFTGGDGLARGYWNRPELTAEKFILHQFSPDGPCQCLYRTGDMARYLPDGNIEFLGRIDGQVKIRGFRIELGEIEAVLGRCPGVRECAVKVCGSGAGQNSLAAYCVAEGKRTLKPGPLRAFVAEHLPECMIPAAFVQLAALPLTPNGKVDRNALPEPDHARPTLEKKYASPRDAVELELTRIWESVLGIEPIGIEDHFFELGGHSLMAVRLAARIEKAFGHKLPLAAIFTAPTIEKLAVVIRDEMRGDSATAGTSVVELQPKGSQPPLFLVHGAGGGMFWGYVNLARRLGQDQPVYGFSSRGLDGRAEFETIEEMAAQYVRDLRAIQPCGPYHLGGYCFGGNVAFEMARQLEAQGEKVALLALLNCAAPNSRYLQARWTPVWCIRFLRNLFYWADYCRQWTAPQRSEFLRWKWSLVKQWVSRRPTHGVDNLIDLAALPEQQQEIWKAHVRALVKFHPQAYSGRVHLFRSPGHPLWCSFEPDYGWGDLARQGAAVTVVKGAHEKILEEPWVDETAAALAQVLEESRETDLEFWKRTLAGAPALLELPADRPRPAVLGTSMGAETRLLPRTLLADIEGAERETAALAALNVVLNRYSGQDDLLVGVQSPTNTVVLRTTMAGHPTGRKILDGVRAARNAALKHGNAPFAELCPERSPSYHPVAQVFFSNGLASAPEGIDLRLCLLEHAEGTSLRLEYAADLFDGAAIQRMLGHLEVALNRLVTAPERPLSELSILTPAESDLLLVEWNRTQKDYPREKALIELFHEQAARAPQAEALVCGERRLTYRELSERAGRVAKHLQALGVGSQSLVGICLERSEDMVAGILGTLQAGGAYVPLDPAYPQARLAFIVQDAKLKVLLTRRNLRGLAPAGETPVLCVEDLGGDGEPLAAARAAGPNDLAYVLYTSGSTGQPKGVALENRSAVAFVSWAKEVFTPEEISGVLASTSICFDLSVFELFVPLACGGKIILADNALALPGLPAAREVTLVNTVPSAMRELLRCHGVPPSVRVVNLAGEPLTAELAAQIYRDTSVEKVYDLYGPTETTTYSTCALRRAGEPATIGRPLANEQIYILDKHMQPAPAGVPGDLYIGGDGLARGYLNRPDLTAERFLPHPFQSGARIYKTGDVARWREDGNLIYLGRSDHQVKIRGFRIELGEIESALKSHAAVAEAVVMAREDRPGEKRLAAYVVTHANQTVTAGELRRRTREKLPDYMTPAFFIFLPKLPLTPNGKVDRRALPAPDEEARERGKEFTAPRPGLEEQAAAVWSEVLGVKAIGAADNFFELGGNSLLAIQVISRLRDIWRIELPLSCLFDAPTVQALAAGVGTGRWKLREQAVPPLEPVSRAGLLPASFMQEQLWFLHQLEPGSDAYNVPAAIHLKGPLNLKALQQSFDAIVARHEALRTTLHFSDGNLKQEITAALEVPISVADLGRQGEPKMLELFQAEARRPFDLEHGPLIRASVARLGETDHGLVIVMHHAVTDGWSLDILFRELETGYRAFAAGAAPAFTPLPVQAADYAGWQRGWMQGAAMERELAYWKDKLAGAPVALELPSVAAGAEPPAAKAARATVELPEQLRAEIMRLGQGEGATTFMVLMTALAITLRNWTGQTDMVLGTVSAGRSRREIEDLIGCFMNFLPLRLKIDGTETGLEALRAVKEEVIESQAHQDCPFEKIVESAKVERRPGRNPLYNAALLFQNLPRTPDFGGGLASSPMDVCVEAALLDLRFEANESAAGIGLTCEYRADLFDATTIERLLASFRGILETLARSPQTQVAGFELEAGLRQTPPETIAVCGTFTTEPVEEPLRFWLDELGIRHRIQFAPYNQVFQQLLDPASVLSANRHGLNIVLIRLHDWCTPTFGHSIKHHADEFIRAIHAASERGGASILVCFCPAPPDPGRGSSKAEALAELEAALAGALEQIDGIYVATSAELAGRYPVRDYDDPAGNELGHIPYTPMFFTALATLIARKFHALRRPACKVIVLDCDQTLWQGVCGEDGPKGIQIDPQRAALQQFMRRQREMGKLLAVCSKNDEADVNAVFDDGPAMPLAREHFSAWRVNWRPKSENLKAIAEELKLGLDSFIFVDDNPVECAEVQANCPEALALALPEDPARIPEFLEHCWAFDQLKTTAEDRSRGAMYLQNRFREQLQAQAGSFADFIKDLQLEVQIAPAAPAQLARVAQLTQRTNQFNASGKRRTESELKRLAGQREVAAVSVKDRFGDYGLVGAMIFEPRDGALVADSFMLSCRALGRGVEHRMLAWLGSAAAARGAKWVDVPFERLSRNQPALDFLESAGASFKQAHLFHFPAEVAAAIAFNPQDAAKASSTETAPSQRTPQQFNQCRKIAMEWRGVAEIHRKIEARPAARRKGGAGFAAPRTSMERRLCELWQRLLRVEQVGIDDDFFELGGHSLLAVRLFAQVEKMTGRKLPLVTLFQAPTVGQLASILSEDKTEGLHSLLVPIQPNGSKPPLYLVHGAGGDVLWGYANLVAHTDPDQPLYALRSRAQTGMEEFERLEDMAACYVQVIRSHQPEGPYHLGGYCFGGNVAYEMARQIQAEGGKVALLALLDSAPSNSGYEKIQWWRPDFAGLFARNLYYWLQDFRLVPAADRRRFIARKLRSSGRKVVRWMRGSKAGAAVDLEEVIDPSYFPEQELKLWQIHLRALANYAPQPSSAHVTLFRTRGHPLFSSFAEDLRWGGLAAGGVTVKLIPGSHENIFMEPNAKSVAQCLSAALAAAQESAENKPALFPL
ncbi:MAG TPA: amino acid adenylation domain-containing protein [Verrucomicrobiae bacterium]|jgi:amino acid adenylation domain-containing protein/FkbH-like protein